MYICIYIYAYVFACMCACVCKKIHPCINAYPNQTNPLPARLFCLLRRFGLNLSLQHRLKQLFAAFVLESPPA